MLLAALYATCLIVGVLVGLAGVGGILVPPALILLSGLEPHEAMGTALASFFPVALAGTWLYGRLGQVPRRTALPYMLGGLAALPGPCWALLCRPGRWWRCWPALFCLPGCAPCARPVPAAAASFGKADAAWCAIGAVTGLLAGMTGAGGPVLSIPWMIVVGVSAHDGRGHFHALSGCYGPVRHLGEHACRACGFFFAAVAL